MPTAAARFLSRRSAVETFTRKMRAGSESGCSFADLLISAVIALVTSPKLPAKCNDDQYSPGPISVTGTEPRLAEPHVLRYRANAIQRSAPSSRGAPIPAFQMIFDA